MHLSHWHSNTDKRMRSESNKLTPKFSVGHRRKDHCNHHSSQAAQSSCCFYLYKMAMDCFSVSCIQVIPLQRSHSAISPCCKRLPRDISHLHSHLWSVPTAAWALQGSRHSTHHPLHGQAPQNQQRAHWPVAVPTASGCPTPHESSPSAQHALLLASPALEPKLLPDPTAITSSSCMTLQHAGF